MPRKFLRLHVPSPSRVLQHRWLAHYAHFLQHPNLWHLNRRSVAGGVAIGLLTGLIPGPFQMPGAVLLAVPLKKNLPVALATTLYSNPLTIVPLYLAAYEIGAWLIHDASRGVAPRPFHIDWMHPADAMIAFSDWILSLGPPLLIGLPVLALALAISGYVLVRLGWRAHVLWSWQQRARKRRFH